MSVCSWCRQERSRSSLTNGHYQTRECRARGHELRAGWDGYVRLGSLVLDDGWRVEAWLPTLLRGRAPYRILPTRAKRRGNANSRREHRGWYPEAQLWIPKWVNLLFATQPREQDDRGTLVKTAPLVSLLRWAGSDARNALALAAVYDGQPKTPRDLARSRRALFQLFIAGNPGMRLRNGPEGELVDLQE